MSFKIASSFSTRPRAETIVRNNKVYKFTCPEVSCNATYYGYTQIHLKKRVSQHRYKNSSIYTQIVMDHNSPPPKLENLTLNFEVSYSNPELIHLKFVEAMLIKYLKQLSNLKYNELYNFLSLFGKTVNYVPNVLVRVCFL